MTPLLFTVLAFVTSIFGGLFGSLLGLGGGLIVVPVLTLGLGVDIRHAVGASLVSVIATSSGAAAAYVRERMTNLRVAMLLEVGTTTGALVGGFLAGVVDGRALYVLFGLVLAGSALAMYRKRHQALGAEVPADPWADRLALHGSYPDAALGRDVAYRVTGTRTGLGLMVLAGVLSGLLGIGSGALKVPAMDLAMRLPLKVSSATSNFMIGVTAAAGAGMYFARGDIDPFVAGPVAIGILIGALVGSRLLGRIDARHLRVVFVVVLCVVALQMLWKGVLG